MSEYDEREKYNRLGIIVAAGWTNSSSGPYIDEEKPKRKFRERTIRRKKSTRDVQWLRRTFALTGDDHEPLYSENGWTNFTTQKGYTMKLKLMSVFVDDQDKALKFYTDVLGFAKKLDLPTHIGFVIKWRGLDTPEVVEA